MTQTIFESLDLDNSTKFRHLKQGEIVGFTAENIRIKDLQFCTGLVIYNSETGLVAAGHDGPSLGEKAEGKLPASLDKMLEDAPESVVAYAISTRDIEDITSACEEHGVCLQGFLTGETYWDRESGEMLAYKKDLIVDAESRKVYFFERKHKKAEWKLKERDNFYESRLE